MPKTTLRTIKYADFVAMVEETTKTLEKSPDTDALALLQSNIEAVKDQAAGKTLKADDLVAIQVIAKVDVEARITALEAKVADLAAKISSAASAGDGKKSGKEKSDEELATEKAAADAAKAEAEKGKTPDEKKAAADAKEAEDKKKAEDEAAAKKTAEEKAAYEKMSADEKKAFDEKKTAAEKEALAKSAPKPWPKDIAGDRKTPTQMFAASRREPPKARP
jgi:colicin import membrane protein